MPGETEKEVVIQLVPKTKKVDDLEGIVSKGAVDGEEEHDENADLMFKLKIMSGEPDGLKISKKNVCIISICEH